MAQSIKSKNITPQKKEQKNDYVLIYAVLAGLGIIFIYLCIQVKFLQDDSYIFFRYVRNFVNGNGLVFNVGERVEGYTSLLWTLLLSLFAFLKMDFISISQYLSVGFGVLVLVLTYFVSKSITPFGVSAVNKKSKSNIPISNLEKYFNLIPAVLLTFVGAFNFWSVSGMESTMYISFCLLSVYFYIKSKNTLILDYRVTLFMALASLSRPEGYYFFLILIFHYKLALFLSNRNLKDYFSKLLCRQNLISYLVYILPVGFHFLFRYLYYGYPFPNTFYAKTGLSSAYLNAGLDYFYGFATTYLVYGIVLILPLLLLKKKEIIFEVSFFYLLIVLNILYIIVIGGDVLQHQRFFLPILPFILILLGKSLLSLFNIAREKNYIKSSSVAFVIVIILTGLLSFFYYNQLREQISRSVLLENSLVKKMTYAGNWFNSKQKELKRPIVIAASTIGAVSYFSDVTLIDMLGLTDKEIAHNPAPIPEISSGSVGWKERNYNVDYVLSRKPDFIYFSTGIKPSAYAERGLFTSDEFLKCYYPVYVNFKEAGFSDCVYKRKTDEQINSYKLPVPNPAYKKEFVNFYNGALNLSKDKNKVKETIDTYKQCADMGPSNFSYPYSMIGDMQMQMKNKKEALRYYSIADSLDSFNMLAAMGLYQLFMESNDSLKAKIYFERIKNYAPEMLQ